MGDPGPDHSFSMKFHDFGDQPGANSWQINEAPQLTVAGKINISDTLNEPIIIGGTIKYFYDDVQHTVSQYLVRNSLTDDRSKIKYSIDEFGNIQRKDIFTSDTDSNSYLYKFNYLNKPLENIDATGNITRFSYDGLQQLSKIKNADTSFTLNSYSYQNGLSYYFGTVNGVVEMREIYR
ncbi:MAG: hypothetical protein IPL53_21675 [Ignavibacteria bacterium]|nr:hypothetical protein [Ignavibacteria bacterium]